MKVGEHPREFKPRSTCEHPVALMITHERPGMLSATVDSFLAATPGVPLAVFDDGSASDEKRSELDSLPARGVTVFSLPRQGFIQTWRMVLLGMKDFITKACDSVVLLEDDLRFAPGWLDVLATMQAGAQDRGLQAGAMTCLRVHHEPQAPVVDLDGVKAYQSMMHGFQVNLVPREALERSDVIEESIKQAEASEHGLDVHLWGNMSHRLGRTNFMSEQSWVAHVGAQSIVEGQGYKSFAHPGYNLVDDLKEIADSWK